MRRKITRYPHIRSGPSLSSRFNNSGGNTLLPHGKLRLTAYILVFLHASLAAFRLNVGFAHAQNIIQVSESAQAQKSLKYLLRPQSRPGSRLINSGISLAFSPSEADLA